MSNIKVLVVDDSAVVRNVLGQIIEKAPGLELIGKAADPVFAENYMEKQWPDVIILDIEMPRKDGITFLREIMQKRPTPVIICSTLTEKAAQTTMLAMSSGAVEVITKPKLKLKGFLEESSQMIVRAIKDSAAANLKKMKFKSTAGKAVSTNMPVSEKHTADVILKPASGAMEQTTEKVIAIGTSTGGTNALENVLTALPKVSPGIVIVQHMPEQFTGAFANRLNGICEIEVLEAKNNDTVLPGRALIAPGGKHMLLKRSGAKYFVEIIDGPLVSRHKPSVDVLFRSVAKYAGKNSMGIIMTGMGDDGASGLLEMRDAGAYTIGQDEASCVVYGMPKEAKKKGAVDKELSLEKIPEELLAFGLEKVQI